MDNNRRKYEREEVYNKVLIDGEIFGYVRDVSAGGMKIGIMKIEPVELKDRISVKILSKEIIGNDIVTFCQVKWTKNENLFKTYGLEFVELTKDNENLMEKYINYVKSLEDEETSDIIVEISEVDE